MNTLSRRQPALSLRRTIGAVLLSLAVLAPGAASADAKPRKADRDRDGLSDRYEVRVSKTSPRRKDTDRDRLRDRYELRVSKTSPRRRDTDRDGLSDGDEVLRWKTNPRRKDSNGDGITDGVAVLLGSQNARKRGDRTPPTVSFRTPVTGQTLSGRLGELLGNCEAIASDSRGIDRVEFYLDGRLVNTDTTASYACVIDTASYADGQHTIEARAYDPAGNSASASVSVIFANVAELLPLPAPDTTAPDTSISSGPSGSVTSTSATFEFSSTEAGSTFECKLDAGSWASCSSPKAYSGLAVGSHSFEVRAKDAAGNTDATPASRSWTIVEPPAPAPSGTTYRDIPVSPAGFLGNFNLTSRSYVVANRFVLDRQRTIDRWYANVVGEGTDCVGGRTGYGDGDGGTLWGRIVEVNQTTGMPTGVVLGEERVNGCTSWQRAKNEFSLIQTHAAQYFQFPAVTLEADRMYAFLLSNVHSNPGSGGWISGGDNGNHMSTDHNFAPLSQMGPHGRNNLDPAAPGALYGLDPRETTMWSGDTGSSWKFGDQVGWYQIGNGQGRMWTGAGYRIASSGENVAHGWPYNNDPGEAAATVTFKNAPKAVTVTRAGGSSSTGNVGVVTVKNLRTGVQGQTASLGTGVQRGNLSTSVPIAAGDSYTVANSGVVDTGDGHRANVFKLGQKSPFEYSSSGSQVSSSTDMPMLFASPHPYY